MNLLINSPCEIHSTCCIVNFEVEEDELKFKLFALVIGQSSLLLEKDSASSKVVLALYDLNSLCPGLCILSSFPAVC